VADEVDDDKEELGDKEVDDDNDDNSFWPIAAKKASGLASPYTEDVLTSEYLLRFASESLALSGSKARPTPARFSPGRISILYFAVAARMSSPRREALSPTLSPCAKYLLTQLDMR
jgi:hypothetical protein